MKSRVFFLVLFVILSILINNASASSGVTYYIKEMDIMVTLPSDLIVFSQESEAREFENLELDGNYFLNYYKNSNIYLDAVPNSFDFEIVVGMDEGDWSTGLYDFKQYSDSELEIVADNLNDLLEKHNYNARYLNYSFYNHPQAKFIVLSAIQTVEGSTVYGKQYYTILGGRAINVTLHSYTGPVSVEKSAIIKRVVDSIEFGESYQKSVIRFLKLTEVVLGKSQQFILVAVTSYLSLALYAMFSVIKGRLKERRISEMRVDAKYIPETKNTQAQIPKAFDYPRFCRICGAPLISDSVFCSYCGTEIVKATQSQ